MSNAESINFWKSRCPEDWKQIQNYMLNSPVEGTMIFEGTQIPKIVYKACEFFCDFREVDSYHPEDGDTWIDPIYFVVASEIFNTKGEKK
tara:strand:+ start:4179 stop:4448 length:270 start_codon:yes stop_codon:yes gene_type:complete